ncbi:Subtilin biosynthesis protein spaB [Fibrella aestuarina BUZ 2]|uniref:Subtilin biosynthesis protein spaB n=1 Tax=Fibrella aestuarina BUZ 2 TaxID=1166018 RepID=I0K5E6_9BACT|nr:lantibiotic dehydratase [Fibrella aestuarina]CCG99349.1 Subtilin biosynthesis protein spaB [Fibrella aestuarina BUZ 2]
MTARAALTPASYFLLRTPSLPINTVDDLHHDPSVCLPRLWRDRWFNDALFVSSPALHTSIQLHLDQHGWPLPPSLLRPLTNYVLRISTRSTPFGLMAGCSVGSVDLALSQVRLQPLAQRAVLFRRLDMDCVARLVQQLLLEPAIRQQVRFFTNNSHYTIGDELRYIECDNSGAQRRYFVSAVGHSPSLQALLDEAVSGRTIGQLMDWLVADGHTPDLAQHVVAQLIDSQLIVSELEPELTGGAMLPLLRAKLVPLTGTEAIVAMLNQVEQLLSRSDLTASAVQEQVRQALAPYLSANTTTHLIQTDLFIRTTVNQLSERVVSTITDQLGTLLPLNQPRAIPAFRAFVRRFQDRYDGREIPLLEALDGEFGVGYGTTAGSQTVYAPLTDGLQFPAPPTDRQVTWGAFDELALKKWAQALRTGQLAVELTLDELAALPKPTPPPASAYVAGNLLSASEADLDKGDFQFNLLATGGPSAANLLGRFCAHSPELTAHVQASLAEEALHEPDTLFAEVVHWPDDRLGNVLIRPAFRPYEIPYISRASVGPEQQLPASDLLVSVGPDGLVRLRSRRYNRPVVPRLSNAHNYQHGLSVYQFLADLQHQHATMTLRWHWGLLDGQAFLPRITFKNLILCRANWTLPVASLPLTTPGDLAHHLQTNQHAPRWIALAQGDNELVIDLSSTVGQQTLFDEAKRLTTLRLVEWLATPEHCWLTDGDQRFVQELVLPISYQPVTATPPKAPLEATATPLLPRSFAPGSAWLYVKLYTGAYYADELLAAVVTPLLQEWYQTEQITAGFFIRYYDPDFHLRLRVHSERVGFTGPLLDRLHERLAPYLTAGIVHRVQIDTYEREVERYGAATMALSEQLFSADSLTALTYLAEQPDPADRWLFALQSCDALLTDFAVDLATRTSLLQTLQAQFLAEHHADQALRKQLNDRFRAQQRLIEQRLADPNVPSLSDRSAGLGTLVDQIRAACGANPTGPSLLSLLASYLHMTLNRLFTSAHRQQEMVVYHFLARYYESQLARQRKGHAQGAKTPSSNG